MCLMHPYLYCTCIGCIQLNIVICIDLFEIVFIWAIYMHMNSIVKWFIKHKPSTTYQQITY